MKTQTLLALAFLTGCGNTIDAGKVEASITSKLATQGITATASCPGGRAAKAGDKFDCELKQDGATFTVHVEQTDDQGTVSWKLDGLVLDTKTIVDDARTKMPGASITCAKAAVVVKAVDTVTCAIAGADQKQLTIKIDNGQVSWSAT